LNDEGVFEGRWLMFTDAELELLRDFDTEGAGVPFTDEIADEIFRRNLIRPETAEAPVSDA
jgi:hypothetical protein